MIEFNESNNMPSVVRYFNKYFDSISFTKQANNRAYAQIKYMMNCDNDIYFIVFEEFDLEKNFNSAKNIASTMEAMVKYNIDEKEISVTSDSKLEDIIKQSIASAKVKTL